MSTATSQTEQATFYFHDYETFGLSPAKDRPAQFAGIRTDADFNIIGEPLMIYCKPPADYLPDPQSSLITGITPQKALQAGYNEADFIKQIHQQFAMAATCIVGYNNIRFDDEVTRYTLYRNFYDPYAYAWQQGNSRWDILDMVRACYALRPEGIEWPVDEEGKPSFRLEKLTVANNIAHANAHDALSDVLATIEMAKLVKQAQPKLFAYLYELRHKNSVKALIDVVTMKPLVHVSGMFSPWQGCVSWVSPLAWHPTNQNAVIMADLNRDLTPLLTLTSDEIRQRLYTPKSELGDLPAIALKLVHINKCPVLATAKTLSAARADELGLDREQCRKSLELLRAHPEIREKVTEVFNQPFMSDEEGNPDHQLYSGFFNHGDKATMDLIRATPPELLAERQFEFSDPRLPQMLFRYRARNWPHTLTEPELRRWRQHCQDYFAERLPAYLANLDDLMQQHHDNERNMATLKYIYHYLNEL